MKTENNILSKRIKTILKWRKLNQICFAILLGSIFVASSFQAQTFIPSTSTEVNYPSYSIKPVASAVPGLYCNARKSTVEIFGDVMFETSAWTEDDGLGWENGYFTYGYAGSSGVYTPVGTISIPGAKHLSAAYMEAGGKAYIIAAYEIREKTYYWDAIKSKYFPMAGYQYAHRYRLYQWNSPTSSATFVTFGNVGGLALVPYPSGHPLYPGYYASYACDGTIVMDVSYDATKVAFAYSGNCGGVMLSAAYINPTNPASVVFGSVLPPVGVPYPSYNAVDLAFRYDPTMKEDFVHTLMPDGSGNYFVTEHSYNYIMTGTGISRTDDFTPSAPFGIGTSVGPIIGYPKLDVPDVSSERRWAYTWTDGNTIWLRRGFSSTSTAPNTNAGTAVTNDVNVGLLAASPPFNPIYNTSSNRNLSPTIAYSGSSTNLLIGWNTDATIPSAGSDNWTSVELTEFPIYPALSVLSDLDYLNVQTNTANGASQYIAFSHHSETAGKLYTTYTNWDISGDNLLEHKNHDLSLSSSWRSATDIQVGTKQNQNVSIGPNPFINTLNLTGHVSGKIKVQLTDITGRVMFSSEGSLQEVNTLLNTKTPVLSQGTYFINIENNNSEKQTFKVQKSQ